MFFFSQKPFFLQSRFSFYISHLSLILSSLSFVHVTSDVVSSSGGHLLSVWPSEAFSPSTPLCSLLRFALFWPFVDERGVVAGAPPLVPLHSLRRGVDPRSVDSVLGSARRWGFCGGRSWRLGVQSVDISFPL